MWINFKLTGMILFYCDCQTTRGIVDLCLRNLKQDQNLHRTKPDNCQYLNILELHALSLV